MQFMLLLVGDEKADRELSEAEMGRIMGEHGVFTEKMRAEGAYVFGVALQESSAASTVDVAGDGTITDGPYAETAEHIGGIYFIEADDLDKAIEWARQVPASSSLRVEVRPVVDM